MKRLPSGPLLLLLTASALVSLRVVAPLAAASQSAQARAIRNVLVVTMDGMRWQEVFGGMNAALLTQKEGGVSEAARKTTEARFGGATPEERRAKLLPFIWTVVAKDGQV